jgi:hypothetical protein
MPVFSEVGKSGGAAVMPAATEWCKAPIQSNSSSVIASEAKQSILPRKERMDCFAALAMTWRRLAIKWSSRHAFATSPRHAPEAFAQSIARAVIASQRVARMRAR